MKYNINAKIISNKKIGMDYYKLVLRCPEIALSSLPGQFISILVNKGDDFLLRRPFSINKIEKNNIHIIYKVVGKGTEILRKKKKDEYLNILGPLGKGFKINDCEFAMLVGGGYGVAPMFFLAKELKKRKIPTAVLIGAKDKNSILCEGDFKKIGIQPVISTEDGSYAGKGLVTDYLKKLLKPIPEIDRPNIYACGPHQMLKKVAEISKEFKTKCYVSLESMIACGVGACLGCAVKVKDKSGYSYKMVCTDGPVFDSEEILW